MKRKGPAIEVGSLIVYGIVVVFVIIGSSKSFPSKEFGGEYWVSGEMGSATLKHRESRSDAPKKISENFFV